ncbi:hypothetical protein AVEN_244664-1 [Araneus ventricosus]|uniref:Uncharacterized protein n=1 Tax=Araneus ventricosus TaxID=182803 RepID=A0A4Y2KGZ5_ARAVE|nr:hypothetical protein AVEN_244664-1 [Araneus ventricosus]
MPDPSPSEGDSSSKDKDVSNIGIKSTKKNPADSQSKVGGVNTVEELISQITDFNFDPDVSGDLIAPLQELMKIFINKSRDIKAGVRDLLNEKVIIPLVKFIQDRETTHLSNIYDLKARHVDVNVRQYQAKIRECESTIEYLRAGQMSSSLAVVDQFKLVMSSTPKNKKDAEFRLIELQLWGLGGSDHFVVEYRLTT